MAEEYDADELYEETEKETMESWLEDCETAVTASNSPFSKWEQEFIESIREQFDERKDDRKHPLSGKQLVKLHQLYDKV